jgi:hypothetical protein
MQSGKTGPSNSNGLAVSRIAGSKGYTAEVYRRYADSVPAWYAVGVRLWMIHCISHAVRLDGSIGTAPAGSNGVVAPSRQATPTPGACTRTHVRISLYCPPVGAG